MDEMQVAVDLGREALLLAVKLALPAMLAALLVGLAVSVLQSATQVQEQTLSFVPRLVAAVVALFVLIPWMLASLADYARAVIADMGGLMP